MALGVHEVHQYVQRFGFNARQIPDSLSMALGSGVTTPLQMAQAYAVFANGGYKVSPYVIDRIEDNQGRLRAQMKPLVAGESAPQVIDPRNAYIMYTIMQDVVRRGTGARANALGRRDIAGKTGTTNENRDAWFAGFNPDLVGVVYIGFDKPRSMGRAGFGGTIALRCGWNTCAMRSKACRKKACRCQRRLSAMAANTSCKSSRAPARAWLSTTVAPLLMPKISKPQAAIR